MAVMNINIINPIIDLIANEKETSVSCYTTFEFEILSTAHADIGIRINNGGGTHGADKFEVNYSGRWLDLDVVTLESQEYRFTLRQTGKAYVRFTVGNVEKTNISCNKVTVKVYDYTNPTVFPDGTEMTRNEYKVFQRCVVEPRCDGEPPKDPDTPEEPTTPEIDENTNIRIYFDASGSMDSTLTPLRSMRDNELKTTLMNYYGSEANYNDKVRIREIGTGYAYENPYAMLDYEHENLPGKVISLVFMDEADIFAVYPFDVNAPSNDNHNNALAIYRERLDNHPSNYYKGVLFQVDTPLGTSLEGDLLAFRDYIRAVDEGLGVYAGTNGLSDKAEVKVKYDVVAGGTSQQYHDLVVSALNEFGFNI